MTVVLGRRYASPEAAERLWRVLSADQAGFVATRRDGPELEFTVAARDARSARATIDDLLACLAAAERTLGITPAALRSEP